MPKNYLCFRTSTAPALDGTLSSQPWDLAPWSDDFVDIEGDLKPAPPLRTRVKMLWDDECFYIGALLEEPQIWATLTQRDSVIFYDNDFEVFIDPDADNHNYAELEINALNTVWDLRLPKPYRDGGEADNSWKFEGLRTAVWIDGTLNDTAIQSRSWSVEIAIPWRAFSHIAKCAAPPRDGDGWRVNFSRVEWDVSVQNESFVKVPNRAEHNWVWSPQGVIDMHQPERWGTVQFCTDASAEMVPDESFETREFLMQIYHNQRAHRGKAGNFAETLSELGLTLPPSVSGFELKSEAEDFEASATYLASDSQMRRLRVRADSLLWHS